MVGTLERRRNYTTLAFAGTTTLIQIFGGGRESLYKMFSAVTFIYALDMHQQEFLFVMHHLFVLLYNTMFFFSRARMTSFDMFQNVVNLEYSNIPLCIYFLTKNFYMTLTFAGVFMYYRIIRWFPMLWDYPHLRMEITLACEDHAVFTPIACSVVIKSVLSVISALNVIWGFQIFRKITRKFYVPSIERNLTHRKKS